MLPYRPLFTLALLAPWALCAAQPSLLNGFKNPPKSARPHTWWHWINGNISKPGITADLEAMKRFGLGGAQIFNVDVGIPAGDKPFMSESWKDAIAWAFQEAKRLDLEIDIHNGAGWSSSGGPWVTPEHSMQALTWSEAKATGPVHFNAVLPEPPKKAGYYEDIVTYAVKKPADDLRIANIREKAAFDRGDRIDPTPAPVLANAGTPLSDIKMGTVGSGGSVSFDLPAGEWTIIRMGHTSTGAQNEPSPPPGLGLEVDKLSRTALDQFWSGMMATAVNANGQVGRSGLVGALIDSYEVGSQNWTPNFREEFRKRRGYDPMPFLVAVTGRVVQSSDVSERFLWDLRRTVCDLFADNYYGYMAELCHRNGLQFSTEGYGNGSFDNLQINGIPDIPMAEFWIGGGATETTKMVSSSAHTYGKRVVGAESFTADDQHAKWLYDPYAMKALGDKMFSLGINRYIFHRYAHQPWLNLEPGMTMGPWGTNFDRTITWWDQGRAWIQYVSRCQYLLQSGRFVADVLAFEGDDGPNDLPMMVGTVVPKGYDYDGCDSKVLLQAKVENGEIVLPSGMRYRLLMLPDSHWMTPRTMRKIDQLVREGAVVVGPQPEKSPSYKDHEKADEEVARMAGKLWSGDTGRGKVYAPSALSKILPSIGVSPDLTATRPVNWIHRLVGSDDVYFVANPAYQPVDLQATFRVAGKQPELWDPESGETQRVMAWKSDGKATSMPLRLESAGSVFVVFRNEAVQPHLENAQWLGAEDAPPKPPQINILSARWEAVDNAGGVDVTDKVRQFLQGGETSLEVNNNNFGDPTYNHVKQLHIVYEVDGKRHDEMVRENASLDFVTPAVDNSPPSFTFRDGKVELWRAGKVELDLEGGQKVIVSGKPSEVPLTGSWDLSFPAGKGAPASARFDHLISWPDSSEEGVKYFSGTATYRQTFTMPAMDVKGALGERWQTNDDDEFWLDLGTVKNFAEVTLNGHALPTLWKAPFRIEVSKWLKTGDNQLEVKVTNLWPNRLIGDEQYPPDAKYAGPIKEWPSWIKNGTPRPPTKRVTFTTWQFFDKDSPLLQSGLMGPVKVVRVPTVSVGSAVRGGGP